MSRFDLYDVLLEPIPERRMVETAVAGRIWSAVRSGGGLGLAMTTAGDSRPPLFAGGIVNMRLNEAAPAVKSWNLAEAGLGMAAINAHYNTPARLAAMGCKQEGDGYCTEGLDLSGKRVGVVGHLRMPEDALSAAAEVFILERSPQAGDYPDSACEYLLPSCDLVIITASSLVNKTLPRLLELCRTAYVILAGPTTPMCSALLDLGINRLAGLVVTDLEAGLEHVAANVAGPPFGLGRRFLLGDAP